MLKPLRRLSLFFPCVLVFLLSGCLPTQELYVGNKVTVEQVPLERNAAQSGTWQTFDITIDYNFVAKGDVLEISGQAVLGDHQRMVYDIIRSLDIYLFFLDDDSRVLLTEPLNQTLTGSTEQTAFFSYSYNIPDGTRSLSFGYSGEVTEQEGQMYFYQLPLTK